MDFCNFLNYMFVILLENPWKFDQILQEGISSTY